jgi:hypothetical protein
MSKIILFSFLFLIIEFTVLFSLFFLPTYASSTTIDEMTSLAQKLQTPWSIHNHNLRETNYTKGYYPRDIDKYWNDKIGDCSEIAQADLIMLRAVGIDAKKRTGYLNDVKHSYIEINGTIAFDHDTIPFWDYWFQKIMK